MFLFYFLYRHMFFVYAMTVSSHFFDYQTFSYIIDPVKSDTDVLEHIHIHLPVFNSIYCFPSFLSPLPPSQPSLPSRSFGRQAPQGKELIMSSSPLGPVCRSPEYSGRRQGNGKGGILFGH